MGNIVPVALTALKAFQTVSSVANIISGSSQAEAQNDLALKQLQQQQALQLQNAEKQAALEKQEIAVQAAEAERLRVAALKRAVARQKAAFGASGVTAGDGSSEAVLLGLFEETEEERQEREKLDQLKRNTIDKNLAYQTSINTLKRTQLQEQQKLQEAVSSFETAEDLFSVF